MSNFIVLVKQVPDVSRIAGNAFDPETGTLVRSRLASVINELDAQALAMAGHMRQLDGDEGKIVCLTMGPAMAEDVLRYSLSRCADVGVLLSDRSLGGADTFATANPLAFAIRKIVKDFFDGDDDYFVVCGMQSVDGDTAQVPAQIAEEMAIPCLAYVTDVEYKNSRFEFRRIVGGGDQIVAAKRMPCVITVAKYEYPLFATLQGTLRANKTEIVKWTSADIEAGSVGSSGSKTRVIRVFPPSQTTRKCRRINDTDSLVKVLLDSFENNKTATVKTIQPEYVLPEKRNEKFERSFESTEKEIENYKIIGNGLRRLGISDVSCIDKRTREKILAAGNGCFPEKALGDMLAGLQEVRPSYSGDVWVVAEQADGKVDATTLELLGKARQLADSLGLNVGVVIAGSAVAAAAKKMIAYGADNVYAVKHKLLAEPDPVLHRKVIADVIGKYKPQIVLFGATPWGRILAPMVSYRLRCGLTADCTSLDIRDNSRKGLIGILMQTRPALGGNVMATICTKDSISQMATARPGVMRKAKADNSRKGEIINHEVAISADDLSLEIVSTKASTGSVDLAGAKIIVSGGKGLGNRDNYHNVTNSLCGTLGKRLGVQIARGVSRAAVEQGFIERAHQVGQTGSTVAPKLYLALGISGAIQHMIGVSNSETIVAVNNDPQAAILKQSDYYMVAKVEDVVPQFVKRLEAI
ncbi:FAD-binding protein [Planctomycetota bacterium]